jgi:hypothetical protein
MAYGVSFAEVRSMDSNQTLSKAFALIMAFALLSCTQETRPRSFKEDPQDFITAGTPDENPEYGTGLVPIPEGTPNTGSQPATGTPLTAPVTYRFSPMGYDAIVKIKVKVNKVLKVKFIPLAPDRPMSNGQYAYYSQLGAFVGIGESSGIGTGMLSNGERSAAQESSVIDLSEFINSTCSSADPSCRQEVEIRVTKPNYDFICLNFPTSPNCVYPYYSRVYSVHPWTARIKVQTDDNSPL